MKPSGKTKNRKQIITDDVLRRNQGKVTQKKPFEVEVSILCSEKVISEEVAPKYVCVHECMHVCVSMK